MGWLWARRRWVIGLVVRIGIAGGFYAWWEYGWLLDDVRFDLDWLVWAGAVLAGYLLMRHARSPWRKAITHETKLWFWHKIVMRIPVVGTVAIQMTMMAQRVGVAHGVNHGWSRCLAAKGSHKRSHKRQIQKAIDEAMVI